MVGVIILIDNSVDYQICFNSVHHNYDYDYMKIKEQLVQYYYWLRYYGLNNSHSGNASVRCEDIVWITPTGCCADSLSSNDLVKCCVISGIIGDRASIDASLHLAVYQANPNTRAVLHCHSPYVVGMTMNNKQFTPIDFEGQLYFNSIPILIIQNNQYQSLPQLVSNILSKSPIVIVRGHGIYACAENLNLAYKWLCSLEHSAKIALIADQRAGEAYTPCLGGINSNSRS